MYVVDIYRGQPTNKRGRFPSPFQSATEAVSSDRTQLTRPTLRSCPLPVSLQSIYGIALYDFTPHLGNILSVLDFVVFIAYMPILYVHFLCTCLQVKGNSMA